MTARATPPSACRCLPSPCVFRCLLGESEIHQAVAHVKSQMETHYRDDVVPDKKEAKSPKISPTLKTAPGRCLSPPPSLAPLMLRAAAS